MLGCLERIFLCNEKIFEVDTSELTDGEVSAFSSEFIG
jgi:hypothetical protein